MRSYLSWAWVATLLLGACADPVDKAAKKRIFSPEDPPKVVASAAEPLALEQLADDPRVARRVLQMPASEATERLGPHQYNASVTFEWTGNNSVTKLSEKRSLAAGAGGVNGDFDGKLQNSRDQGLEVLRLGGQVYARDLYGKFRLRLRDRGMAERTREDIYGALRDFSALFAYRLKLTPQGTVTYEGRPAQRFDVSLGPPAPVEAPTVRLPAPAYARDGGMDEPTRRRRAFTEKRQVRALKGEVLVDQEKQVVLKARLDGKLNVPAATGRGDAQLHMTLDAALTQIGKDPGLKPPKEFLPDEDKPSGIADVLDRFNIPRGEHPDAGAAAQGEDREPADVPDEERP